MTESTQPEFTIDTMTLTASLSDNVDLDEIAASLQNTTFEPEKIMRVDFKVRDPKASISIFGNGKLVCMGPKSYEDGVRAINHFVELLQKHHDFGQIHLKKKPLLKNVKATAMIGLSLDLDYLSTQFDVTNYDPTIFPGLFVKMNGSATATLFASGNINFTGVDTVERMREFVNETVEKVRSLSARPNIVGAEQERGV